MLVPCSDLLSAAWTAKAGWGIHLCRNEDGHSPVRLLSDFREEEEGVEELVRMWTTYE